MTATLEILKEARIDEAAGIAASQGRPDLGDFLRVFFTRGAAEDVVAYTSAELAAFAGLAMDDLGKREPGRHRIRIVDPDFPAAGFAHRAVTVVEILNDNMPFLVDSVMQELAGAGVDVRLIVHPILSVRRNEAGTLVGFADPAETGTTRESLIHVHVARLPDATAREDLTQRLDRVLTEVRAAVSDWAEMRHMLKGVITDYETSSPPLPQEAVAEAVRFLNWLADDNFTFLGLRQYEIAVEGGDDRIALKPGSGLGLLRDPNVRVLRRGRELVQVTPEIRDFMRRPEPLIVTKANVKSRVHRHAYMDYVGIKHYDGAGRLVGELRLVGLFTASAYTLPARAIPYLRQKVQRVMDRAGLDPESHSGKSLLNVLESYPRDDLFQIDFETLYDFAMAILELGERPRIRVLARRDKFDRFVSVLVFVPRDRYSTDVRIRLGDYLKTVFAGRVSAYYPGFPEGTLARVHFIIGRDEGATPNPSQIELEAAAAAIVRTWADDFQDAAHATLPAGRARIVIERFAHAFSAAYRDSYGAADALADIAAIERLTPERMTGIAFRRVKNSAPAEIELKLFNRGGAVPLSIRVPILEAMGFRVIEEKTFEVSSQDARVVIHDMALTRADGREVDLETMGEPLRALFMAVWLSETESDRLNALLVSAGLAWREIALIRALTRYLQQAGIPYDQGYIAETLNRQPAIAAKLVELFKGRFDPSLPGDRSLEETRSISEIDSALDAVTSLDDDLILGRLRNLVTSATRTTFYQLGLDGRPKPVIALKFDPHRIDALVDPKPFAEIWVYSPRVEGVHLRFGKVARGGLRWSDRPQDFRTEVLGLVKAQQVKNAVIVPVGAKGGFFPKRLAAMTGRDAIFAEGTEAYKIFVSTLLDLTDNIVDDRIVPPDLTVRHDGDDPYLVVAADKGTATFSDTANAISDARGFWLSDAFASGGSAGYDHKKMGITARGAWEAVKRHFREMDVDIQTTPFTVAGVGDMSGDVFGNGMLLSPAIRLVAAFDHRDIFIDPTPDAATSFAERRRLFDLPRSSWADYDTSKISLGGGVFSRSLKSIQLSSEVQALLGLDKTRVTPQELITAILKAPVDLLWFGGIGTYVRGPGETDAEVGDRANDAIRITAGELHAKVVGEGANLGMTQRARIAYGLAGGRCNSDAVDNSAGVNSSDVEVNIKIALRPAVRSGRLTITDRNVLLSAMTPEVARLVLENNDRQSLCVSLAETRGMPEFGFQRRLMQVLEARRRLDRAVETLPEDAALARRETAAQPLTRPEIGVLMAYAKLDLFDALIESTVPDDPAFSSELFDYFPLEMQHGFAADIRAHRLSREIVSTRLGNAIVNRGGPTFVVRIEDQTGASATDIARAYQVAVDALDLASLEAEIDALDAQIAGKTQLGLYLRLQDALLSATLWLIRNKAVGDDLAATARRLHNGLAQSGAATTDGPAVTSAMEAGVPAALARRVMALEGAIGTLDLILVAEAAGVSVDAAATAGARVADVFRIGTLDALARGLAPRDYYEGLALDRARRTLSDAHRRITVAATRDGGADGWITARRADVDRTVAAIADLTGGDPSVARFTVAAGLVSDLAGD